MHEQLADAAAAAGDENDLLACAPRVRGPVVEDRLRQALVERAREPEPEECLEPEEEARGMCQMPVAHGQHIRDAFGVVEKAEKKAACHDGLEDGLLDGLEEGFEGETLTR